LRVMMTISKEATLADDAIMYAGRLVVLARVMWN
jgi:hypothetical protein